MHTHRNSIAEMHLLGLIALQRWLHCLCPQSVVQKLPDQLHPFITLGVFFLAGHTIGHPMYIKAMLQPLHNLYCLCRHAIIVEVVLPDFQARGSKACPEMLQG